MASTFVITPSMPVIFLSISINSHIMRPNAAKPTRPTSASVIFILILPRTAITEAMATINTPNAVDVSILDSIGNDVMRYRTPANTTMAAIITIRVPIDDLTLLLAFTRIANMPTRMPIATVAPRSLVVSINDKPPIASAITPIAMANIIIVLLPSGPTPLVANISNETRLVSAPTATIPFMRFSVFIKPSIADTPARIAIASDILISVDPIVLASFLPTSLVAAMRPTIIAPNAAIATTPLTRAFVSNIETSIVTRAIIPIATATLRIVDPILSTF